MRRSRTLGIIGVLLFFLTIVLFSILTKDRIAITWISFYFILFAEFVLFGGLIGIESYAQKASPIISRVGAGIVIIAYSLISIATSLIFLLIKPDTVKLFWVIQLIVFVIAAIAVLVFGTAAKSIMEQDAKVSSAVQRVSAMVDRIALLMNNSKNSEYKEYLSKAVENLKFSDTSTTVTCDDAIEANITKLEMALLRDNVGKNEEVIKIAEEIINLINRRKLEVKNTKLGGI